VGAFQNTKICVHANLSLQSQTKGFQFSKEPFLKLNCKTKYFKLSLFMV